MSYKLNYKKWNYQLFLNKMIIKNVKCKIIKNINYIITDIYKLTDYNYIGISINLVYTKKLFLGFQTNL